jgi:hypothetical protein
MKVVVVDESPLILELLRRALSVTQLEVSCVHDFSEVPPDTSLLVTEHAPPQPLAAYLLRLDKRRGLQALRARVHRMAGLKPPPEDDLALAQTFLPLLAKAARERLRRALDLLEGPESGLARELRALAGEAQLLGDRALAQLAFGALEDAERLLRDPDASTLAACARSLNALAGALAERRAG